MQKKKDTIYLYKSGKVDFVCMNERLMRHKVLSPLHDKRNLQQRLTGLISKWI